jgi:aminopeptidase N
LNLISQFKQLACSIGSEDAWNSIIDPKVFIFSETAKISTYIYAIVAGPYGYHESNKEGLPPMRIYARKSLVECINHEEMFLVT